MNQPTVKTRSRGRVIFWLIVIVVVALFVVRFWQKSQVETVASIRSVQQTEGKPVEVSRAVTGDLETWTTLAGTVEGCLQYAIISTNSIRVTEVVRQEGERVKPGDVVIRLEKTAPNPMLHSYNRSRALYEDALTDYERMKNLYEEGAVSKQALDKAEMVLKVARADLANATESTELVATQAGIITSVLVEEGEMASAHKPLAWVANTDSVKIDFEAGSRQAMVLAVGQKAVWYSRGTGESGEGRIRRLDLAADPETHLLNGEACFPNQEGKLIPGLLVSFRVRTGERRGVVKIPIGCLMGAPGEFRVYVVEQDAGGLTHARLRDVDVGLRNTDEAEVLSGLVDGDLVVEFGQTRIADGDLVKVIRGGEGM